MSSTWGNARGSELSVILSKDRAGFLTSIDICRTGGDHEGQNFADRRKKVRASFIFSWIDKKGIYRGKRAEWQCGIGAPGCGSSSPGHCGCGLDAHQRETDLPVAASA